MSESAGSIELSGSDLVVVADALRLFAATRRLRRVKMEVFGGPDEYRRASANRISTEEQAKHAEELADRVERASRT